MRHNTRRCTCHFFSSVCSSFFFSVVKKLTRKCVLRSEGLLERNKSAAAKKLPSLGQLFDSLDAEGSSNWPGQRGKKWSWKCWRKNCHKMLECGFNSRKNSKKMKKFLEKIGKKMKIMINCLKKHPRLRIFFFLLLRDQTLFVLKEKIH